MILTLLRYLQTVGEWHSDGIQEHAHNMLGDSRYTDTGNNSGNAPAQYRTGSGAKTLGVTGARISNETKTRAYGLLGCVYVGIPV